MGIQTLTIKTCDRCGAQMHDHLSREHPENGELRVAWDGHMGGMAWNGDCGGASFNGKALLCHRCEREFLEWIKPRADGVLEAPAPEPCPRGADKPEPTCTNRHQCWEPCGELGKSEEHVRVGRDDPSKSAGGVKGPEHG